MSRIKRGDRFRRAGQWARVMTVSEGWAMLRFKGAAPFVVMERELLSGDGWFREEVAP